MRENKNIAHAKILIESVLGCSTNILTLVIGDLTYLFHHTALRGAMTPATPSAKKFKQSHDSCDSLHSFSPLSNFSEFSPTKLNNIFDSVDSADENHE